MKKATIAGLATCAMLCGSTVSGQSGFERVHTMPFGYPGPVAAAGDLGIYGISNGVLVVEVSDPSSPVRLSRLSVPGHVNDVVVDGDRLFIASGDAGVAIVDLTAPTDPLVTRVVDTPGNALGVAVFGGWVFVADDDAFLAFDLSGDRAGGAAIVIPGARKVAIDGNLALVDGSPDLWVIDISDPVNMVALATIPVSSSGLEIDGRYALVGAYEEGLLVFDLADPVSPVQIGSYSSGGVVWAIDEADGLVWLMISDFPSFSGVRVVDVSDPAVPVEVGSVDLNGRYFDICVNEQRVHLGWASGVFSNSSYSLPVLDGSDPTHPVQSGAVLTSRSAAKIVTTGDLALIGVGYEQSGQAFFSGIDIIDFSEPFSPVDLATLATPDPIIGFAVDGPKVVSADGEDVLRIYDISMPSAPTQVGTFDLPTRAAGVAILGDTVFVADWLGFRSIDISDPSMASEIAFIATSHFPSMVLGATGDYVFYGFYIQVFECYGGGFGIVDVTDPSDPFEAGFDGSGFPEEFVIVDDQAFDIGTGGCLGNVQMMVGAYDMSSGGFPIVWGAGNLGLLYGGGPSVTSLTVIGNQLLAGYDDWIYAYDKEDLSNDGPIDLDHTFVQSMATVGNHLLVADDTNGVMVFFDYEVFVDDFESGNTGAW